MTNASNEGIRVEFWKKNTT